MLSRCKIGPVVLASRDRDLHSMVADCLTAMGSQPPRLTTVKSISDCVVAVRLLDPCLVLLDDGIHETPGPALIHDLRQARTDVSLVYLATRHSLELERQVRCEGVLFYIAHPHGDVVATTRLANILKTLLSRTS